MEEIAENQFSFDPTRYNEVVEEIVDGVPFETIIKSINRGAPLAARDLDDIASVLSKCSASYCLRSEPFYILSVTYYTVA